MSIMDLAETKEKEHDYGSIGYNQPTPPIITIYHYEKKRDEFTPGEVFRNFNGHDYRFIERYKHNRYLMLRPDTGMFLIAYEPAEYVRNPVNKPSAKEYGLEWNHARYLSSRFADVDMDKLREQYGAYIPNPSKTIPFYHRDKSINKCR